MSLHSESPPASSSMELFRDDVIQGFEGPLEVSALFDMSKALRLQYREALGKKAINMNPAYHYKLPTGDERGTYLIMDVGGSILRLALFRLNGRDSADQASEILRTKSWKMDNSVKALESAGVLDWIAASIKEAFSNDEEHWEVSLPAPIGLSWSHPIESTSIRTANIFMMAKGFEKCDDIVGREAGSLIIEAFRRQGFEATIGAIVHDLTGNVLADAYRTNEASIALIYGTGVNAAVDIPANFVAPEKFPPGAKIPPGSPVVMNTELSVYGKDILPTTRWDDHLNREHRNSDVQPLEYLIGGRYIGEIIRLILVDAIQSIGLLGGTVPDSLSRPYSLDTKSVAEMQRDPSPTTIQRILTNKDPPQPLDISAEDCNLIQRTCQAVSHRAAAYLATALHALWTLRHECRASLSAWPTPTPPAPLTVRCHGSVILKYPGLMERCQTYLDELAARTGGVPGSLTLKPAHDATLLGAAVAVACNPLSAEELVADD